MREETDVSQPLLPKRKRPFGICYGKRTRWFETEKARDQSYLDLKKKIKPLLHIDPTLGKGLKKVNKE
jgi:hypothetical protein